MGVTPAGFDPIRKSADRLKRRAPIQSSQPCFEWANPPMPDKRTQRRLAAILAADVVGYSRLIEEDASGTLAALKERRKDILKPQLSEHQGRMVKVMGDGVLAEFGSA